MSEKQTKPLDNIIPFNKHHQQPSPPSTNEFERNYINASIGIDYLNNLTEDILNQKFPTDRIPELKVNLTKLNKAIDGMHHIKNGK